MKYFFQNVYVFFWVLYDINVVYIFTRYHGEIIITTQFEFELSPPDVCTSSYNPTLLIVVFSKTAEERSNIRQTWAKVLPDKVKVIFVLGKQEENNEKLLQEFQTYGYDL